MNGKVTIELTRDAFERAEARARKEGLASAEVYVESLIRDDDMEAILSQDWMQKAIQQGLDSPDAGELTRERLKTLVEQGMDRAKRK
ncbi:MAG: hypothetical protein ACREHE_00210 [Rhizomicrobium sp.]